VDDHISFFAESRLCPFDPPHRLEPFIGKTIVSNAAGFEDAETSEDAAKPAMGCLVATLPFPACSEEHVVYPPAAMQVAERVISNLS
jgi:hypothetical protein